MPSIYTCAHISYIFARELYAHVTARTKSTGEQSHTGSAKSSCHYGGEAGCRHMGPKAVTNVVSTLAFCARGINNPNYVRQCHASILAEKPADPALTNVVCSLVFCPQDVKPNYVRQRNA